MARRVVTLVLSTALVLAMVLVGAQLHVPYAGLGPGPTYNTLGTDSKGAPLIQVTGRATYPTSGHLNLVTVSVSGGPHYPMDLGKALRYLFDKHVELVPESEIFPPGQTSEQVQQQDNQQMQQSQSSAEVAALGELGIAPTGVQVFEVTAKKPAFGVLKPADQIVSIDGQPATSEDAVTSLIQKHKVGDKVTIGVTRDGKPLTLSVGTVASADKTPHPQIGVVLQPTWPFTVSIHVDSVGGPSAGMMFALGLIDKLTPGDLTGGKFIAGTGEIENDGTVDPIGGITQKMYGVRQAGAQYFLAPAGNCNDVVSGGIPSGLQVIKVTKLHDALAAVKAIAAGQASTLPVCTATSS
ncbi:PDZ domain-containing protein [Acidothermaceae bacterium B102]|nr:PDZ domain-containing protein [Acidothermaceae bacterium B102]